MTNPVAGRFQFMHTYDDDKLMTLKNLEIMWLTRYPL